MATTSTAAAPDLGTATAFTASQDRFDTVLSWLQGEASGALTHGQLEEQLQVEARELFRQLFRRPPEPAHPDRGADPAGGRHRAGAPAQSRTRTLT